MIEEEYLDLDFESDTKDILKELILQCTPSQQHVFRSIYSNDDLERDIYEIIDRMPLKKVNLAISQCEASLYKIKDKNY